MKQNSRLFQKFPKKPGKKEREEKRKLQERCLFVNQKFPREIFELIQKFSCLKTTPWDVTCFYFYRRLHKNCSNCLTLAKLKKVNASPKIPFATPSLALISFCNDNDKMWGVCRTTKGYLAFTEENVSFCFLSSSAPWELNSLLENDLNLGSAGENCLVHEIETQLGQDFTCDDKSINVSANLFMSDEIEDVLSKQQETIRGVSVGCGIRRCFHCQLKKITLVLNNIFICYPCISSVLPPLTD